MKKFIYTIALLTLFALEAQAVTISKLYGVTGDDGTPEESLFELDMSDASSTFVLTLGNGGDGEEIAFNPDDGLLYHVSGPTPLGKPDPEPRILESIHPGTLVVTPVTLSGFAYESISGLTYAGSGVFLASHNRNDGLSSLTTAGVATNLGPTDAAHNGLAFIGSTLYAVDKNSALLRTIDPATGESQTTVTITLTGHSISGATGLAANPIDDALWVLLKVSETFPTIPAARALATVDPTTGVATLVGITENIGFAGIAFVSGEGYTVTPSVGTDSGSITPSGPQPIISGQTTSFLLTPDPGYVIESVGGTCGGTLVDDLFTTAPVTADCTVVANFEPEPPTKLYGVTGDGGYPAETLFRIDMTDASTTLVLTLGNGNDGEEIAFNRDDGLLYHASGTDTAGGEAVLETINLATLTVTPIALSGFEYKEVSGMTYAGSGVFLASHNSAQFSSITTAGVAESIGTNDNDLKGLAFIGTTLYAVGKNEDLLRTIDPATGGTLDSVTITLPGYTVYGATGLATNPDDNSLWALLRTDDVYREIRVLAVIDPVTGAATYIGTVDVPGMAGIAFGFIPCDPCEVTPSVGGGPGTITPSTVQDVDSGATTAFTLTPDLHYHSDFVDGTCGGSLASDVFTTTPITTHCEVVAYFAVDTYDLAYTAGPGGSITGEAFQTVEYNTNGTEVTANPNEFYHFVDWSDGFPTASRTDTAVSADINVTANFEIDSYAVTSSVGTPSGAISPMGSESVDHGSTTQYVLTPSPGYHIGSVDGTCGGSLDGNTFTTAPITGACTVIANFVINTYDLVYTVGVGGSIIGSSPQTVTHGASGTQVTAEPDDHYHFVDWSDGVLTASRTDTNVVANLSVTANFAVDTYTVTSSVGTPPGSITPSGGQEIGHGSTAVFTLTPAANYHIASVDSTCGGSLAGSTFTTAPITGACTVVANFTIDTFDLTYTPGPGGSISGTTLQTVNHGASGTQVTAEPNENYHFVDWSDGVLTASRTDTNVTVDINVTANFAQDTHTVTSSVGTPSGTINPVGGQTVDHNSTTQFTLTPASDYHIDSVGGTCGVGSLVGNTYTTSPILADCTVIANFTIDTHAVTSSVGTGLGSISPLGGQPVDHGSTTQFTVTPDSGYHVTSVSGSCGGALVNSTYTTNTITSACTVVANFAIDTFNLNYSAGANGSVSGNTSQTVNYDASGTPVTAVPDPGYHFVDWDDGVLTASRTDTNVMADISVTANFAINTYTVTSSVGAPSGSINPLGGQSVDHGSTKQFTLSPATDYHITSVGGTCGGSLAGSIYTTNAITTDCTVIANFAIDVHTVTPSLGTGSGSINPPTGQPVDHGSTTQFTLTPATNYHITSVGGTCGGSLVDDTYTTASIIADCTVVANFEIDTRTVTSSVGTGSGSISPSGGQSVDHGSTTQFILIPGANFHIASVGGTCGGSLVDSTYTTSAVTTDCTVVANFEIDTRTVTSSVGTGSGGISPLGGQSVDHGSTTQFTLTPAPNYHIASVGGTCGGSLVDNTYSTASITADCTVVANFAIDTLTVTSSVGAPSGSISPLGGQSVDHGSTTQFTLTPAPNYHIATVGGTCGGSLVNNTYTTNTITADCTVVANFAIDSHTVTSSVGAGSGSISPLGGQSVEHGSSTQFNVIPDADYHIASVGGTCGGSLADNTFTTTSITANCTVVANFAINTHTATSSVGTGSGSITPLGGQSVDHGSNAQFTLTPAPNYHIDSVGGTCGGSLTNSTYTTNAVTADCTVVANFAIDTHTVTSSVGTGPGSISPLGGQSVDHGSTTQFTLTPATNYRVASVGGTCGGSLAGNTFTTAEITSNCTVVANFEIDTYTVTSSMGTGPGTINPLGGQTVNAGATVQFTLTPDTNYHIGAIGGTCGGSLAGDVFTTNPVTDDCTVVANFAIGTHTVTSSVGTGPGGIDPLGVQTVNAGTTPQFTLTPADNYHVDSVGGTCGGSLVGNTFTTAAITADCTVIANFTIDTFDLTYSVSGHGSISGNAQQTVDYNTNGSQVTAVPDPNYHFVDWSDGETSASRTDTNVMADISVTANFAINTYTVTSSVGTPSGGISPLGGNQVDHGLTRQFTLAPATGHHIVSVGGTCGGSLLSSVYTTAPITANCTVVANFAIDTFDLAYTAGANGSISGNTSQTVNYDASGTEVTAVPDTNYHFVDWSDGVLTASRTDTNVMADISVTANFAIDTFDLSYIAGSGGSITGITLQTVEHGTDGTEVTAVPLANYNFVDWSDGVLTASRTDTNVTADINVTANFATDAYELTYTAGAGGSITGTTPQTVDHGEDGSEVTAVPDTNHHFVDWSDGVTTASRRDTNVIGDLNVTANFALDTFELSYTAGAGGSISGATPQTIDYGTDGTEVTAMALANYHFVDWSDGVLTASRTDTNVTADINVTANFALDTYELTYTAGPGGSISGITPQTVEHGTDGTGVTAVPDANYHFVNWSDGVATASRTDTNVMADINVTANFAIDTFDLTYAAGAGGSITGITLQTVDHGADGTEVTAVPDTNYHFVDWSDGVATASRLDANVVADINVTANFALNTFVLTYTAGTGGSITGDTSQTVDYGKKGTEVTAVPDTNFVFVDWSDGVQTASRTDSNVMIDLDVTANFTESTHTVTSSVGTGSGDISPLGGQSVDHGQTTQFTLTPGTNYHIGSVGGTCDGSLAGNIYTTSAITVNCTVVANFAGSGDVIFKDGFE